MTALASSMHPKFTDNIILKLHSEKVTTVLDFIAEEIGRLVHLTCLRYKDIVDIKRQLLHTFAGDRKKTSHIYHLERVNTLSTGIQCLDALLDDGLRPGQIYEVCGTSASGKTQLCLTIATKIAIRDKALVHYIDTKRDFSIARLEEVLNTTKYEKGATNETTMNQIKISSVVNVEELFNLLNHMAKGTRSCRSEFISKIIIIDSLPAILFKYTDDRKTNYSLNKLSNLCRQLANQYNLPVLLVNLLTQWNSPRNDHSTVRRDSGVIMSRPALGKYWLHITNTRLLMERLDGEYRRITVWKSFRLKMHKKCNVEITDAGVISTG